MFFEFNPYSGLLLIGFLQGLVYAGLLISRRRLPDYLMAALLFFLCLTLAQWMLGFAGWYDAHDWRTTLMFYMPWYQPMVIGPLLYLYLRSLTNRNITSLKGYLIHFLPAVLITIEPLIAVFYDLIYFQGIQGQPLPYFYHTRGPLMEYLHNTDHLFFTILEIAKLMHLIGYLVLSSLTYRRYQRYLRRHFSNLEPRSLTWLRNTLYISLLGIGLFLGFLVANKLFGLDYDQTWIGYLALGAGIYIISIQAYHHTARWHDDLAFEPGRLSDASAVDEAPTPELLEWKAKLDSYMQQQRPYLDPDLNLADLARQLNTNGNQLSRVINTGYQINFNDYINKYRVQEVISRMEAGDHHQFTLLSLAMDSGFNSKATFNRAFKKITGKTPGAYAAKLPPAS